MSIEVRITGLSPLAVPGTAAADLARLNAEEEPELFAQVVEEELDTLRPYGSWRRRAESLLRTRSVKRFRTNPAEWAASSACKIVADLRCALETAHAAGIPADDMEALQSGAVLAALEARVDAAKAVGVNVLRSQAVANTNAVPMAVSWGGVYFYAILRGLRTVVHASGLVMSRELASRITAYASAKTRDVDHRLFAKETYLAGAAALDAFGRIALAAGRVRGHRMRAGARLLAVAADGAPRRAELGLADRRLVFDNVLSAAPEVRVYVRASTSKARRTRTLRITDPRAVALMSDLRAGPGGYELFRDRSGAPLTLSALDTLLRRATIIAVGQPATYNILRRANAGAQKATAGRRAQLGHANTSTEANDTYHRTMVQNGVAALAAGRAKARAAAVRASENHAASDGRPEPSSESSTINDSK